MNQLLDYIANHPYLTGAALLLLLAGIVLEIRHRAGGMATIGPLDAVQLANQGALVLDVRTRDQYEAGHILDARHVPAQEIKDTAGTLNKYREKPIVVYCDSGYASASAAKILRSLGFAKVATLRGGLQAWLQENMPVVKEAAKGGGKSGKGGRPA